MKKITTVLTLLLGLSLSTIGIIHAYASGPPTGNYQDTPYKFRFLKGNPYDETDPRRKYNKSYYYMYNTENNTSYTVWARSENKDASGGHYYTIKKNYYGKQLLYNLAVEHSWWGLGSPDVTIGAKKNAAGHANGVWSPDYDRKSP
ncbi:hypothetical protein MOF38_00380 [Bacillus haynesii]|uniref:hypothetical protein n=1 Tax=Bacillus haynesii TaxID=1925021 RepID=UPI00227D9E4E|nr:hypothetical protein [Bacillus haynesii]MCY7769289.1 hypothetical protein [Bacillus haynesii]MCY8007508.1 hypothetical protein [Bacillus haynesii]MCY8011739.1 hypothetical protein [Bacillus haynesii]MCY8046115.1 hypothetical protein [Bacillus haynesii]MCY8077744.1 hypothetical protein [Bacillus haynesii]